VTGPGNRPLKSLSDMLKGKQGRFRQNLLGKRVDYSGRSVIVAGPELRLYQCGLPKLMALELFKPFIMSRLVERKQVQNIKAAKKMVDSMIPEVWDVLEEVIAEHPVLLNRAPTLHRLGIQAFEPVLVEGKAIQLHPLVCTAFNADFDGDQMAVHLPLSVEAQSEARILMLSANNILSPAHGRPIAVPSQDMILGLYYLTYCPTIYVREKGESGNGRAIETIDLWDSEGRTYVIPKGHEARIEGVTDWVADPFKEAPQAAPRAFRGDEELLGALDHGIVSLQDLVEIRQNPDHGGGRLVTTAGRVLFNHELRTQLDELLDHVEHPHAYPWQNRVFTKRELGEFIEELVDIYGATIVSMMLDTFKALGFRYASQSGITISKNDVVIPPEKSEILAKYDAEVQRFEDFFSEGLMTAEERHERVISLWDDATDEVAAKMQEHLFRLNPIFMMANSGARGSFKQIRQLAGMRGCMANPKGEIIERPIKSNFMEGLSVLEYFISTHGARKGLADTALKTADSGYLTRRLVDVSQDVIVRERDCGTTEGIDAALVRDGHTNPSLLGRVLIGPVVDSVTGEFITDLRGDAPDEGDDAAVDAYRSVEVDSALMQQLTDLGTRHPKASVTVRSPLKCRSAVGVCTHCYGRNLASGEMCEPGDAVGIIAAQSIGEPGTQLTMRTFHTGGVAGADITQGLPRIVELFEARKPKALAHVAAHDGWIRIEDDETRPGAAIIHLESPVSIEVGRKKEPVRPPVTYNVLKRTQIRRDLEDGSWVEAGDLLTDGSAFPSDILEAQAGIDMGIAGTVASVTPGRTEKGSRSIKVEVLGEDGVQVRHIRVPVDRPAPPIHDGMHLREGVHVTGPGWGAGDRATKTEDYLVAQVQDVYRSQGVEINDKHIEVIVRQMLRKVRIEDPGDTNFLPGQLVDKPVLFRENQRVRLAAADKLQRSRKKVKRTADETEELLDSAMSRYVPLILGITKASLATESFLSAASFQETTKVLTDAALEGKVDHLRGLKENVIIGKLIPAATGLRRYRQLEIEPVRRAPALLEFDLDEPFSLMEEETDDLVGLVDASGTYSFEPEPEPAPEAAEDGATE
jgi:DNA-directed RNA polymerase subunit beta'